MKFKHIGTRMFAGILPVLIAGFLILTSVAMVYSKSLYNREVNSSMLQTLDATSEKVLGELEQIKSIGNTLAITMGYNYKNLRMDQLTSMLGQVVECDDMVNGSGVWFEPYVYDSTQQYMGPYVYRDGDSLTTTMEYSNADYNYFDQEYYN